VSDCTALVCEDRTGFDDNTTVGVVVWGCVPTAEGGAVDFEAVVDGTTASVDDD
jgi:hypothetical protein